MEKFGLFHQDEPKPRQVFEGTYIDQEGEYVKVYNEIEGRADEQVAAVRLNVGESVKKLGMDDGQ
jgi:hypothetical protein